MEIKTKLEAALDELLIGKSTEEIVGPNGLLKPLTKARVERAVNAELSHHLGYEKHAAEGRGSGDNRNGKSRKKVQAGTGDSRPADWHSTLPPTGSPRPGSCLVSQLVRSIGAPPPPNAYLCREARLLWAWRGEA